MSVCPNHQTGRVAPLETRGIVAMDGILGYELDSTQLSREEKALCREQITRYKRLYGLIAEGDYYRLTDPYRFGEYMAWQHVSKDRTHALLSLVLTQKESNDAQRYVKAKGLDPGQTYCVSGLPGCFSGQVLMSAGIPVPGNLLQYEAIQFEITIMAAEPKGEHTYE